MIHAGPRTLRAGSLALLLASNCGDPPAPTPAPAQPSPAPAEFRAEAHVAAYERLRPLAQAAFDRGDPLAAAQLTDAQPPAPLPFSQAARAALRKDIDAAWTEAEDIDGDALGVERAALLRAIRFGLGRLRDEHVRRPSSRVDPALGLRTTARLLAEIERRGLGCAGCDRALAGAAIELDAALADLGASTRARALAAVVDCDELRGRIGGWGSDAASGAGATALLAALADLGASSRARALAAVVDCDELRGRIGGWGSDAASGAGATALLDALARARTQLDAIATALPAAKLAPDGERIAPAAAPAEVLRLPDRMGAAALRRWLDVHESEAREAQQLVNELGRSLVQLDALARKDQQASDGAPAELATAVDLPRCAAQWASIAAFVKTQPALAAASFDCATALPRLPARADDAALSVALVQRGVIEPTELAQRRAADPLLARVGGTIAPAAHRHALAIAVLSGLARPVARARVLVAARDDVCLAITALWIHGELGDDATLAERIAVGCGQRPVEAWIADATARPERALDGLGLGLLALGPADAVALEQFWWLPLGLVIPMARPAPPPETPVEIHTEPLVPGGSEP